MNETGEWICKYLYLMELTAGELRDIVQIRQEIDDFQSTAGPDFEALQSDLRDLVACY